MRVDRDIMDWDRDRVIRDMGTGTTGTGAETGTSGTGWNRDIRRKGGDMDIGDNDRDRVVNCRCGNILDM